MLEREVKESVEVTSHQEVPEQHPPGILPFSKLLPFFQSQVDDLSDHRLPPLHFPTAHTSPRSPRISFSFGAYENNLSRL